MTRKSLTSTICFDGEPKVLVWGLNDKDQLGGLKGSKVKMPVLSETLSSLHPVHVAGGSKSLFVVSQEGKVRVLDEIYYRHCRLDCMVWIFCFLFIVLNFFSLLFSSFYFRSVYYYSLVLNRYMHVEKGQVEGLASVTVTTSQSLAR